MVASLLLQGLFKSGPLKNVLYRKGTVKMKLTQIKNSDEFLPGKKSEDQYLHNQYCDCCTGCENCGFNEAIDAYNNLDFGGDVEKLADVLMSPSKSEQLNINFGVINRHKAEFLARRIIYNIPSWVVLKKGEAGK